MPCWEVVDVNDERTEFTTGLRVRGGYLYRWCGIGDIKEVCPWRWWFVPDPMFPDDSEPSDD